MPRGMSRVWTAPDSPKSVSLAMSIASWSSPNFISKTTGPNTSSSGSGGLSIDVLQDRRRHDVADRFAAHQCFRAGRHRVVDLLLNRRDLARIDQRPDHGGRLRGIPGSEGAGLAAAAVPEVRRNTGMHQDAVGGHTDLACRWCV